MKSYSRTSIIRPFIAVQKFFFVFSSSYTYSLTTSHGMWQLYLHVLVCLYSLVVVLSALHPFIRSSYLKSIEPLRPPLGDMVTLTEWQVVRETLWACLGAGSSFVYEISDSEVIPRKDIQVLHLTPVSDSLNVIARVQTLYIEFVHGPSLVRVISILGIACL